MANGPPYVVEFLFRGRDAADETGLPATYHVILGRWVDTIDGGRKLETGRTLRPGQATAAGFPLNALTGAIAAQAMIDKDAADAGRFAAETARDTAVDEKATAVAEKAAAEAARDQALADLAACQQGALAVQQEAQQAMKIAQEAVAQRDMAMKLVQPSEATPEPGTATKAPEVKE